MNQSKFLDIDNMADRGEQSIQDITHSENFKDIDEIENKYKIDLEMIYDQNNRSQINKNQQNNHNVSSERCSPVNKNTEENQVLTTTIYQNNENNPLTSLQVFQIEDLAPVNIENNTGEPNNIVGFYKYHSKSLLILLANTIILKFFKNLIPHYCFAKQSCDCSNNDILVKIWSMIMIQYMISHGTWILYCLLPELFKELKSHLIWQQICSSFIFLILAFILDGQSQIFVEIRLYGLVFNLLVFWIIGIIYMRRIGKAKHFSKTHIGSFKNVLQFLSR